MQNSRASCNLLAFFAALALAGLACQAGEPTATRVIGHPLERVVSEPNPVQDRSAFMEELTIHKTGVAQSYRSHVPDFPQKPFGLAIWRDYVEARYPDAVPAQKPLEDYLGFLRQAAALVVSAQANGV